MITMDIFIREIHVFFHEFLKCQEMFPACRLRVEDSFIHSSGPERQSDEGIQENAEFLISKEFVPTITDQPFV